MQRQPRARRAKDLESELADIRALVKRAAELAAELKDRTANSLRVSGSKVAASRKRVENHRQRKKVSWLSQRRRPHEVVDKLTAAMVRLDGLLRRTGNG